MQDEQNMFDIYRLVTTWACTNICFFFSIQGEDNKGIMKYICKDEVIHKGQFRMLIVKLISFQQRNDSIIIEPIQYKDMISFNLEDERGIVFRSITVNELLKIRSLKKILKYQFSREWSVIDCLDENLFNDNSHLIHFHQFS
jgi:hypothetical protein